MLSVKGILALDNAGMEGLSKLLCGFYQGIDNGQISNCREFNGGIFLACTLHADGAGSDHHICAFYLRLHTAAGTYTDKGICPAVYQLLHRDGSRGAADTCRSVSYTHLTVLDSFSHANIGPRATKAGRLLLEVEAELENAVPNITLKYEEGVTEDEFALEAVRCALDVYKRQCYSVAAVSVCIRK